MLGLVSVSVPEPTFTSESAPAPLFWMMPEKVEVTEPASVPLPTYKVTGVAEVLSTMPEPLRPLMIWLKPFKSNVPPAPTVNTPGLPMPLGMTLAAPA